LALPVFFAVFLDIGVGLSLRTFRINSSASS
jgi:hypothetical protein